MYTKIYRKGYNTTKAFANENNWIKSFYFIPEFKKIAKLNATNYFIILLFSQILKLLKLMCKAFKEYYLNDFIFLKKKYTYNYVIINTT